MSNDIRTLKKFKVLWVKEYSKKSKADAPGPSSSLIARPPGEKGKNGWNLQEALGLKDDDKLYGEILVCLKPQALYALTLTSLTSVPLVIASADQAWIGSLHFRSRSPLVSRHVSER